MIGPAVSLDVKQILVLDGYAARGWSEESWRAQLSAGDHALTLVAHGVDGRVHGVAAFRLAGDVVDLLRVAVLPELRSQGIGRRLVMAGVEWALTRDVERMMLEVEPGNKAALALYERIGFAPLSVRRHYYGAGKDALVMVLDLAGVDEWELQGASSE